PCCGDGRGAADAVYAGGIPRLQREGAGSSGGRAKKEGEAGDVSGLQPAVSDADQGGVADPGVARVAGAAAEESRFSGAVGGCRRARQDGGGALAGV